ncbi:MAG TPA: DUF4920 domain-containing protein [Eudoraea sp.]|nr:DUF4920 domain-containing protein [Eudoraea sp.]
MKSFNILLIVLILIMGCKQGVSQSITPEKNENPGEYVMAGKEIDPQGARGASEMLGIYHGLSAADTVSAKFKARVKEVCQAKGCWMKLELKDGQEAMVTFKDYGFFVPVDIKGKEVIIKGNAFLEEMSVEDQIHFAKDSGKTQVELNTITTPKKTFGFIAEGVLISR